MREREVPRREGEGLAEIVGEWRWWRSGSEWAEPTKLQTPPHRRPYGQMGRNAVGTPRTLCGETYRDPSCVLLPDMCKHFTPACVPPQSQMPTGGRPAPSSVNCPLPLFFHPPVTHRAGWSRDACRRATNLFSADRRAYASVSACLLLPSISQRLFAPMYWKTAVATSLSLE